MVLEILYLSQASFGLGLGLVRPSQVAALVADHLVSPFDLAYHLALLFDVELLPLNLVLAQADP